MAEETHNAVVEEPEVEQTPEQLAAAEELAGFEAAIEGTPLPKTEVVTEESHEEVTPETVAKEETPAPVVVEPPLAKVTEEQFNKLVATATTVDELKAGLEKLRGDAFGKLGGIERLVKQYEKITDSGLELALTDADYKDIDTEVPMLTKPLQALVSKILKAKVKVPAAQAVDLESLETKFEERVQAKVSETATKLWQDFQTALVTRDYPDWRTTVSKKEFQVWLADQDKDSPGYQQMFQSSWDANVVGGALKKFNAHIEAEKSQTQPSPKPTPRVVPKTSTRTQRLLEALPGKANSTTPRPKGPQSEEEAFASV